ncbi:iron-sulfur cluster assembly protein SufB [Nanobdella aerobiophila]|uniref:Iron-sulfur cluster assembly protein SufB n=1 Tax=Nanobdella aerobiophila TaxID=2586965 RepID=A0A915SFT8_9ARCH|nr:Fe-S cluster assembly protein SufB [Nanobdella aerobiophila]BBL45614.1 iron-sulfur cluster assembly protein SufB [Nanobdella aerobiophila]
MSILTKEEKLIEKNNENYNILIRGPLDEKKIKEISELKGEPDWMFQIRLKAFKKFQNIDLPRFGPKIDINFDKIIYYGSPTKYPKPLNWNELPSYMKETIEKLGLKQEFENLSALNVQYDSIPLYKEIKNYLDQEGIIFTSLDEGVKEYPEIVKKYFSKVVPEGDNKFAALNTAVWSGGVFIYVPENKRIDFPLHAYFIINLENLGQFERTLIITEKNAKVTYIEGCTAPVYSSTQLHAAVVELFANENSNITYGTIQNWSKNVYNLVTKRARVGKKARVRWISGEFGSKVTMLYPGLILDDDAEGEIYTIGFATDNQNIDTGGRIFALGKNSKGYILSKSIAIGKENESISVNRIDIKLNNNGEVISKCDSLIEEKGKSTSIPRIEKFSNESSYNHEAKMEKINDEKILYLRSLGIEEKEARRLFLLGFMDDILNNFPESYKLEIKRILDLELEEIGGFG